MKFDLDTAWKDTTAMLRDSFGLLAVIAGVFYFIPYTAVLLWAPGLSELMSGGLDPSSEAAQAKIRGVLSENWWVFLLLAIVQGIGFLAMLALLKRRANPTVGQAIQSGARAIPSYLAASILMGLVIGLAVFTITFVLAITGIAALQLVALVLSLAVAAYLITKLSLASPVIAIDGVLNPVKALTDSWRATKGNSFRLFAFYGLLMIAYIVISSLVSMVFALIFALGGAETQVFGQAITSSLMNAAFAVLFAGVLAAVHAQLTRLKAPRAEPAGEEF